MSLYAWIDVLSISVPLLVSFHPRIQLHLHWKSLFLALAIAMVPYIVWDVYFTQWGYWGFNSHYLSGVFWWGLPIEEWLFFICIPYACIFTHTAILTINNKLCLGVTSTRIVTRVLLSMMMLVAIWNHGLAYTLVDMAFAIIILFIVQQFDHELLRSFYITFLFMLIPFLLVNGVLTGSGIDNEVVWYNNNELIGMRLLTIPIEDIAYAFSLILLSLFLFRKFKAIGAFLKGPARI